MEAQRCPTKNDTQGHLRRNEAHKCPRIKVITSPTRKGDQRGPRKETTTPTKIIRECPPRRQTQQGKPPSKKRRKRSSKSKRNHLKLLYCNPNGISGKMESLASAATMSEADIITLAETKLRGPPPRLQGYKWIWRNRQAKNGGGVAILVKEQLQKQVREVRDLETHDQEIIWVELPTGNRKLFIGIFYGPQETEKAEETERQYSQLKAQVHSLQKRGDVILTGDFNAKLELKSSEVRQKASRNGGLLQDVIDNTKMIVPSIENTPLRWTRVNRRNSEERSVIDYILTSQEVTPMIEEICVDEEGILRLKGKEESDHNTITMKCQIYGKKTPETKMSIWNVRNKEGWAKFNHHIREWARSRTHPDYNEYEEKIKQGLREHVGKITVKRKNQPKPSQEANEARKRVRQTRKEYGEAVKWSKNDKVEKLQEYRAAQQTLRRTIERDNKRNLERKLSLINKKALKNPNILWETSKKIRNNTADEREVIRNDQGKTIEDPEEAKEHVAKYYEDLYQARHGEPGTEEETERIKRQVRQWDKETHRGLRITTKEVQQVRKCLHRKKASGPDGIPNEVFIEADNETLRVHQHMLNEVYTTERIPRQWQEGRIKRLYKGKGLKGMCANERGITLASNVGKVFERVINNRNLEKLKMTDNQAGGKKGRATADHIMTIHDVVNKALKKHHTALLTLLDVTKAYDKAWLDGIMYVMGKNGIEGKEWKITKKLNEDLRARVHTDHGTTREINIKDSIRQGGVLSVSQYAILMDEISKEIKRKNLGIEIEDEKPKIGCLLWMDDVALVAKDAEDMQEMLRITNEIARRYHIKFGEEKSKVMVFGRRKLNKTLQLGDMKLDTINKYKYLGMVLNNKMNMKDHTQNIKCKIEAAYQTLIAITEDSNLKGIQMKSLWKLVQTCIEPLVTYGLEAITLKKAEIKSLNTIWTNIIKRALMTPQSTPSEAIYIETGLLDIETMIDRNKLRMLNRLSRSTNELTSLIALNDTPGGWHQGVKKVLEKYSLTIDDIKQCKRKLNKKVMNKIKDKFKERVIETGNTKSKVKQILDRCQEWQPEKRRQYLSLLTRKQASTIFRARSRMLQVKSNYKNGHSELMCRKCRSHEETQDHILNECQVLHTDNSTKIAPGDISTENIQTLREMSKRIDDIIQQLNQV